MSFLTGGKKSQAGASTAVSGLQFQSSAYGKVIPIVFGTTKIAPNLIWYGDFIAIPQQSSAGSGGKGGVGGGGGGKGGGGGTSYVYETAVAFGLSEGPIQDIGSVYVNKNVKTTAELGMTEFLGGYSQTPWSYLSTNHPTEALNYKGLSYVAVSSYALGNSPQLSNHNFEVFGIHSNSLSGLGVVDADPSLVVSSLLTDSKYGIGFPSARLGSLSVYQAYTIANGLWISPAYVEQAAGNSMLADIAKATNSEFVWSEGVLKLIPYGDQSKTANGYTYTAPSSVLYALDDDDFISEEGGDPLTVNRKRQADSLNSIKIEVLDRNNQYNPAIVEAKDIAAIQDYGLRQSSSTQMHLFADLVPANLSAQLMLQRQSIKNIYSFTLDQRYILLDPMDLVSVTDSYMGITDQWVRILSIEENDDLSLSITAEEYLEGNGSAATYSFQTWDGYSVDYNSAPGTTNDPVIFEPPVQITQTGLEVWIGVSGATNWGGCEIWVSNDDASYKSIGRVSGPARQGILSQALASGTDPDTTNTLQVNLAMSNNQLLSGTREDADNNYTLCYVDGELISYQTASLVSGNKYNLTYLRRGAYGTDINSHLINTKFLRLDGGVFPYSYDKSRIGQTIYLKFLAFNIFGGGEQALSDVASIPYTIVGPPLPAAVQNFQAQQQGNVVAFTWLELPNDTGIKGYDIAYGAVGSTWDDKLFLTEAHRGTEMTNASVPPGTWEFSIRAHDIADNLGPESTLTLVVINDNAVIFSQSSALSGWPGTLVNFAQHYTGVLTPLGTLSVDQYNVIASPSTPSLSSVPGGSLPATTYFVKITYLDSATGETTGSVEASLAVAANNLLVVTSPATSGLATGWNVYVSTTTNTETKQNLAPIAIGSDWTLPTSGLISGSALPANNTTGWQVFDQFVPDVVSYASYTAPIEDTGYDENLRVYSTISWGSGYGQSGTPNIDFYINTWLTAASNPNIFTLWVIGYILMRYLEAKMLYDTITQGSVSYINDFTPTIDNPESVQNFSATIAPGGTIVVFPTQFHSPPYVQVTTISGSGVYGVASLVTDSQCQIDVYNSSAVSVGGFVNIQVTGF